MKDYIPLLQTILWITLAIIILLVMRPELAMLWTILHKRLEQGSSIKVGPVELGALERKVDDVSSHVDDLNKRVSKLFLLAMSDNMYGNLRKLADGRFGHFEKTPGLDRELRYLRV